MRRYCLILCGASTALIGGCGKGDALPAKPAPASSAAAAPAVTPSEPHFSELRRTKVDGYTDMSALTAELCTVPKELAGRGPAHDAFYTAHHLDVMIYTSEPNFTFQLIGVDKIGFVDPISESDWRCLTAAQCSEALRAVRDEDAIHRDGITCEPAQPVYFLFETAGGLSGMGHLLNENNVLQVETKLVWGGRLPLREINPE